MSKLNALRGPVMNKSWPDELIAAWAGMTVPAIRAHRSRVAKLNQTLPVAVQCSGCEAKAYVRARSEVDSVFPEGTTSDGPVLCRACVLEAERIALGPWWRDLVSAKESELDALASVYAKKLARQGKLALFTQGLSVGEDAAPHELGAATSGAVRRSLVDLRAYYELRVETALLRDVVKVCSAKTCSTAAFTEAEGKAVFGQRTTSNRVRWQPWCRCCRRSGAPTPGSST